jgi:ferredoxin
VAILNIPSLDMKIEASPVVSILNNLLRQGVPINHVCGGKAQCGTCRVKILEGADKLSPKTGIEKKKLESLGNPENTRLACQTFLFGDVSVEIILKAKK